MSRTLGLMISNIKNLESRLDIIQSQLDSVKLEIEYTSFIIKDLRTLVDIIGEEEKRGEEI